MGASKSKFARSSVEDRKRFGRPREVIRKALPVAVVVFDDCVTAIEYFRLIKDELKSKITLTLSPAHKHGQSPEETVEHAKALMRSLVGGELESGNGETSLVWVLLDTEDCPRQLSRVLALQKSKLPPGLRILVSTPCYDMWTLLHLVDTGEGFLNCSSVIERIGKEWRREFGQEFGTKSKADYSKIVDRRALAAARARRQKTAGAQSWTEVFEVIEGLSVLEEES